MRRQSPSSPRCPVSRSSPDMHTCDDMEDSHAGAFALALLTVMRGKVIMLWKMLHDQRAELCRDATCSLPGCPGVALHADNAGILQV